VSIGGGEGGTSRADALQEPFDCGWEWDGARFVIGHLSIDDGGSGRWEKFVL
tara:strand:- start:2468 stop:2623 length:156 start_codon:yes stop_codon:yes gene_type:complete